MTTIRDIVDRLNSHSEAERREILRRVSSMFLERPGDHGDRENEIFGRVFTELLESLTVDDRIDFSDRFAEVTETPRDVVLHLADDVDVRVAGPMLERAPALSEEMLVSLAERHGPDHLLAIARRERLGTAVTDVLVERGDTAVLETVSRNLGATFSDAGLTRLTSSALDVETIAEALFRRLDIPLDRFEHALGEIDEKARERLARLVVANRGLAVSLLKGSLEAAAARRERERAETEAMIALARAGVRRLDGCVDDLLPDERIDDIGRLLGAFAGIEETHVVTVLVSRNDFGLALVCRSLGIGEATWVGLDRLRRKTAGVPAVAAAEALLTYREVDKSSADRALRFHRIRSQIG